MESFTYSNYVNMLNVLKKDYKYTSFSKAKYGVESKSHKAIIRHDIDLSLEKALEMAKIEAENDLSAVYFFFLRSPFYNLFSHEGERIIREIINLQHHIGLHFDYSTFMSISPAEVNYFIHKEIRFMEEFFQVKLDGVSFHRPFSIDFFNRLELGTYPHAYESLFTKHFTYYSDSRGLWRYGHPLQSEAYSEKKNLQLLIHPIWWNEEATAPVECLRQLQKDTSTNRDLNLHKELKGFWDANPDLKLNV